MPSAVQMKALVKRFLAFRKKNATLRQQSKMILNAAIQRKEKKEEHDIEKLRRSIGQF